MALNPHASCQKKDGNVDLQSCSIVWQYAGWTFTQLAIWCDLTCLSFIPINIISQNKAKRVGGKLEEAQLTHLHPNRRQLSVTWLGHEACKSISLMLCCFYKPLNENLNRSLPFYMIIWSWLLGSNTGCIWIWLVAFSPRGIYPSLWMKGQGLNLKPHHWVGWGSSMEYNYKPIKSKFTEVRI